MAEQNVTFINVGVNKQPLRGQNDCVHKKILPISSDGYHDLQTNVKSTTVSKDHSQILTESMKRASDHVCNTVSHERIVAANNNLVLSPGSVMPSCDQAVSLPVSSMGEGRKLLENVKQSSSQDLRMLDCGLNGNLKHNNNPETVNLRSSINNERRALLNGDINDISKISKAHLIDDSVVSNTPFQKNYSAYKRKELIKDLNDGVDINNPADDSEYVRQDKNNLIKSPAEDNQQKLDYKKEYLTEDSTSVDTDSPSPVQASRDIFQTSSVNAVRRHRLEKNPSTDVTNDEISDEDVGIYAESFRYSNWVCIDHKDKLELKLPVQPLLQPSRNSALVAAESSSVRNVGSVSTDNTDRDLSDFTDGGLSTSPVADEVFSDPLLKISSQAKHSSGSETEFKHRYMSRRKCLIQRADSQQEYHRLSTRMYDQDREVILERRTDSDDLGLHLLDSYPAFVTSVDPGSAAEKAGIKEGQILVSVNGQNVLTTNHADIVKLIQSLKGSVKLCVANSDFQPVRDLQTVIMSGYMNKLGNSAFRMWKKRFFTLRQDNCLYYYKNHQETDPLGAFPLAGYTISRHTESNKEHCFKVEKFGGRIYYFSADNRDQLTEWVGALTEASLRSKTRKESFLSVSSHNVGLPALHILKPECAGFLGKLSPSNSAWWRRYCVLKDACVYYYKDKSSFSAIGVIHLHGYSVDGENYKRKKFSFTLQPPEQKMRVFAFSADNETDKRRWVESLVHSIQQWVPMYKDLELVDQS